MGVKVLAWNIHGGTRLQDIADVIRTKAPDIVLLSEVVQRRWFWQTDQVAWLSEQTHLPYYEVGKTTMTGITGWKAVAILSAHELRNPVVRPVMNGPRPTTYAMLDVDARINNAQFRLVSLRFDAFNTEDRTAGHQQLSELVRRIDPRTAVIVGGDFNAPDTNPEMVQFRAESGLTDALMERPDPDRCTDPYYVTNGGVDHVFYRGPYYCSRTELRCPWQSRETEASDHPWLLAELSDRPIVGLQQFRQPIVVQPATLNLNTLIRLTVVALDAMSGAPVPRARVRVVNYDEQNIRTEREYDANVPIAITFRAQQLRDPSPGPRQWVDGEYPSAVLQAPGYSDADVPLNWSR